MSFLTVFIMNNLIINLKLATAGPGHYELQKYPPKRKLYEKIAVNRGSELEPVRLIDEFYWSTTRPKQRAS